MVPFLKSAAVLACAASLVACSSNVDRGSVRLIDTNAIVANAKLTPAEKSEELARAGEQLAMSSGFSLADSVIDQALTLDPNNKLAQLYKALLADKMALRGILVRIKPLAAKDAKAKADLEKAISEMPNGALKDFLLDGQEDIRSEKDVQAFLDEMYEGREQLRLFLKNNKESNLKVRFNDLLASSALEQAMKDCTVSEIAPGVFEQKHNGECSVVNALEVKLNRADMEALQQIMAGVQIYATMYNAYGLSGTMDAAEKFKGQNVPGSVVLAELSKNEDFAKLRNPEHMKKIIEMGVDAIAGVKWASQMQKELCPKGEMVPNQRRGHLFRDGICVREQNGDTSLDTILAEIELTLGGRAMEVEMSGVKTEVKPALALSQPIEDLKALKPKFNSCGKLYNVADSSLNGIFPNDDLNAHLLVGAQCD